MKLQSECIPFVISRLFSSRPGPYRRPSPSEKRHRFGICLLVLFFFSRSFTLLCSFLFLSEALHPTSLSFSLSLSIWICISETLSNPSYLSFPPHFPYFGISKFLSSPTSTWFLWCAENLAPKTLANYLTE